MSKRWYYFSCIAIIAMAFFLRTWQLNSIPAVLNPDEASIGYNAYLLLHTGRDEMGVRWPLVLEAFGDQKIIGYTALTVVSFMLFGISDLAVRMPAVFAGVGMLCVTAVLLRHWNWRRRSILLALIILAVQPVFIWYSRVAFEATVSLSIMLCLLMVALLPVKNISFRWLLPVKLILLSVLSIAAIILYNAPLVLLPFVAAALPLWYGFGAGKSWILKSGVLFVTWAACFMLLMGLTEQKSQITLFADPTTAFEYTQYREEFTGIGQKVLGNKGVFYATAIVENYWKSIQPSFIIHNVSGHAWHTLEGFGYLTAVVYWLGLVGALVVIVHFIHQPTMTLHTQPMAFVLLLAMLALLPAAISVNAPHATRSLLFFWSWSVLAAHAAEQGVLILTKHKMKKIALVFLPVVTTACLFASLPYLWTLFFIYPKSAQLQSVLQPGFAKVMQQLEADDSINAVAVVDTRGFHYILTAWYLQMPPDFFRETVVRQLPDGINFRYGERVGKYHFVKNAQDSTDSSKIVYWDELGKKWIVE